MPQAHTLVATLKKTLKAHGLTYRHVADSLQLSEASVKRLFAQENLSIARLEQICQLMSMEISDLIKRMDADTRRLSELTEAQERELVSDIKLLLVTFLVVNGWNFDGIVQHYKLTEAETIRCLAKLDRLRLIELLPKNRIKLLISSNFAWRRNGPIQRFFSDNLREEFLNSQFDKDDEAFHFLTGILSPPMSATLIEKMRRLAAEFDELNEESRRLPLKERIECSMILAIRPWRPAAFQKLERKDKPDGQASAA